MTDYLLIWHLQEKIIKTMQRQYSDGEVMIKLKMQSKKDYQIIHTRRDRAYECRFYGECK